MLKQLTLQNVGPAPSMKMEMGSRLNLITGDNGLGKSFLLDVAWWALTRKWPQELNPNLTSGYLGKPSVSGRPASSSTPVSMTTPESGVASPPLSLHAAVSVRASVIAKRLVEVHRMEFIE